MSYLPFDLLFFKSWKIWGKFSSKQSSWVATVWVKKTPNTTTPSDCSESPLLEFSQTTWLACGGVLQLHYPQSLAKSRKCRSRFRGHSEVGSPLGSCCSKKSGVETDWEDSTPPPPTTILYNETTSNTSLSRYPLYLGYTAGKFTCAFLGICTYCF